MKLTCGRTLAAPSLAVLWLSAPPTRAAESDCQLVFEAIPSEDAGPIIGQVTKPRLANKNFEKWRVWSGAPLGAPVYRRVRRGKRFVLP